jgi:hypothetical protein
MAYVFKPEAEGAVTVLSFKRGIPGSFRMRGPQDNIINAGFTNNGISNSVVITGIASDQQANVQLSPSLREALYIYSFGDRIGNFRITGIAFLKACIGKFFTQPFEGVIDVMNFYDRNSISNQVEPITISLGDYSLNAYLVGRTFSTLSPETNMCEFNMTFAVPPKRVGNK